MKKALSAAALAMAAVSAQAAPAIDFSLLEDQNSFNSSTYDSYTTTENIVIDAFRYLGDGGGAEKYTQNNAYLWLKDGGGEHGLGVCSGAAGAANECAGFSTTDNGNGQYNELDNAGTTEIIRLKNESGNAWADVWLSSLDSSENARIYWSNSEYADLATTSYVDVPSGYWGGGAVEGSVLAALNTAGWDTDAAYLYFRAGPSGTDNDYLVWGVGVAAVPEPETYAMLLAGLGLLGFAARRRKRMQAV